MTKKDYEAGIFVAMNIFHIEDYSGIFKFVECQHPIAEIEKGEYIMKAKLCKTLGIFIVAMFILSMIAFPTMAADPNVPHAADAMWIEPSSVNLNTATHDVGYKFNVTLWTNVSQASFSWQFKLLFNTAYLNVTACVFSAGGTSDFYVGHGTVPVTAIIDNVNGYVLHGESLVGTDSRPAGWGSLSIVEFVVTAVPEKGEEIISELDIQTTYVTKDTYVEAAAGGDIPLNVYNASYSFVWAPPGPALLSVHNPGPYPTASTPNFFFERSTIWNCTWFTVDIYLDISSAWFITNASFTLTFNTALINTTLANVTTHAFPGPNEVVVTHGDPDTISFILRNVAAAPIGGHVLVATIDFHIYNQGIFPTVGTSPLDLIIGELWDHFYRIPCEDEDGLVTVEGYMLMAAPWLEVEPPEITMGPEPSICKTFDVNVTIKGLDARWQLVGIQFRLSYDPTLIEFVEGIEGPFMQDPEWNLYGTFPMIWPDNGAYGPHVLAGDLLLPDENGTWAAFPYGSGVLFTIRFHVIYQSYPHNFSCPLDFLEILLVNSDSEVIPVDWEKVVNGTYNIVTDLPGRMIDVYTQYPAPFGGQGPYTPSDMFGPQSVVTLYAEVTYNYYPVNNKDVGFEIEGPFDQETGQPLPRYEIWKLSARTDKNGTAWISFQLPWPCDDPEGLFGKWKVTATVDICEEVVMDVVTFDFQYIVTWVDVTVDREPLKEYKHCEWVEITITFKSKAQLPRDVLITAVLQDNLQTLVGFDMVWTTVGGAEPCHWICYEVTLSIHVVQWVFAGPAWIHVNAFTEDPTVGGVPYCPEYAPPVEIFIQPY